MRSAVILGFFAIAFSAGGHQQPPADSVTAVRGITLEEVIKLTKAGVSEEIIVTRIRKSGRAFDLSTEEILELKKSGVTDAVVKILMDPSQPYTPPAKPVAPLPAPLGANPPQAAAARAKPLDPIAGKVPPEPGVYYMVDAEGEHFGRLELKTVTPAGAAGKMSKLFLRKGTAGYLIGPAAKTLLKPAKTTLFVRLAEKGDIEEFILLALNRKSDRREISFGPNAAKPVFPPEAVKQYSAEPIDDRLYRLRPAPLSQGQYILFLLGSGDEKKGILGKGYEFGIIE